MENKGYFVIRSAGSFGMDLLAIKKGRVVAAQVKSSKRKTYYLDKRVKKQLEELKKMEEYGIEGVFAVRFKDYKKTWVFMKSETVSTKVKSTDVSNFNFEK